MVIASAQRLARAQGTIALEPVVTGLANPVAITHAGDGSGRLFISLQGGRILIHDGTALLPTPFLNISSLISCCSERGLLGVAFHPQYVSNGYFFVSYTNPAGNSVVARYKVSANRDVADPNSAAIFLTVSQPFANHNGGGVQFGKDGYLYIGMGDGGSVGDPDNRAQNPNTLLGKMLRIDVSSGPPYAIPSSNPFTGTAGYRKEIWALGLRNPWGFSFDRLTGDLFIADVGQDEREEINFQPATSRGGENYGWRLMEGTACYNPATGCNDGSLELPVLEYDHTLGCSITGGYRYRGMAYPELEAAYFYGDFCSGRIWRASASGGAWSTSLALDSSHLISTFGEDERGELYLAHYNATAGAIYRIVGLASQKDLRIEALSASPTSVAPGASVTVNHQVANRGTGTVTEVYTERIYLSNNATLGGDTLLGTSPGHTAVLAANTTHANSQAVTIPAATAPGSYFLLVEADALGTVAESNEGNNVSAIPITIGSSTALSKDLRIEAARFWPTNVGPGGGTTVVYDVANRGSATVTEVYKEKIYLSKDAALGGDTLLATSYGPTLTLATNTTHLRSQYIMIPAATAPGSYFLLVQADALGTVAESNEGNNVTAIPITLAP